MTTEEAINILCAYGVPLDEEEFCEALNKAIKALKESDFLTFLMNNINKNELEKYFSMYRAINEITESEEEE